MHDTNLLQLINDDLAPAQQLLELLRAESVALHGRDMPLLEDILAQKQALVILLEQHGRKRTEIL
ncbi:flagellar export chaperone FlgN, partial [Pseudomonas sp. MWU12-2323]